MFCPECGEKLVGHPDFCPNCGFQLNKVTNEQLPENRATEKTAQNNDDGAEETMTRSHPNGNSQPPKNPKKRTWIIALVAVVVILVVGGAFAIGRGKTTSATSSNNDSSSQSASYSHKHKKSSNSKSSSESSDSSNVSSNSVSSSSDSENDSSTSGVDQNNLTTAQVDSWVWKHFSSDYAESGFNRSDYSMDMYKDSAGLLQIDVRENHDSANMQSAGADPDVSPRVASYQIDANGALQEISADGSATTIATKYGE